MNSLFVYGTLCPGKPNAHLLENIGGTWEKGYVYGTVHQIGWGAAMGYPGLVLDDSDNRVDGFVFYSDKLALHWQELDEFEGTDYQRVPVKVYLEKGGIIETFVYTWREE